MTHHQPPIRRSPFHVSAKVLPVVMAAVAVVVVGGVIWGVGMLDAAPAASAAQNGAQKGKVALSDWAAARRQSFDLTVLTNGELEAKSRVEVRCEVEGQNTIITVVPEGTMVKKGDVLIQLATDQLELKIEEETLKVDSARTAHLASQEALAITQSEARSTEDAAQVAVTMAKLDLKAWENGADPQKRNELDLAMEKAIRNLDRAKRDLELSEQLYEEKFISLNELDDDKIALIEAEAALATAKLAIEVYKQYTWEKEQTKVKSDLAQAEAELDRTIRKNASKISQVKAELENAGRTLAIHEERLAKLKSQLDKCTIVAPGDGMVVYATTGGSRRRDDTPIQEGREVRFNETLIRLPDTSHMIATLKVHEALIRRIKPGQDATVTVDARRGGAPLAGKVMSVGVMADSGGWGSNPDLREYAVEVELPPNADAGLKPSMRCTGEIFMGRVEDALSVPVQAVFTEGAARFVYISADRGRVRKQPVTIGQASESLVEIKSGLEEGVRVLLRSPRPGEVAD